jgi:hypothetical protein
MQDAGERVQVHVTDQVWGNVFANSYPISNTINDVVEDLGAHYGTVSLNIIPDTRQTLF